jgi:murein DD-endopeptidase MepM/ murein hydrolase activator NlpD
MAYLKLKLNKKGFLILILSIALILGPYFGVLAESTKELNQQVNKKKEEIDTLDIRMRTLENQIAEKQAEAASLSNQLVILDAEISKTETEIQKTEAEIEKTNLEIKSIEKQIQAKEKEIVKQQKILSEIIRTIYQYDQVSLIEILLSYDSLSDFLDQTNYLETIEKKGKETLDNIRQIKKELEWQNQVLKTRQQTLDELKKKLDEEKVHLDQEKQGKEKLLQETESEEEKYQELLSEARAEQEAANVEIARIQQEIEQKLKKNITEDEWKSLGEVGKLDWPIYPTRGISAYFMDPSYSGVFGINHYAIDIPAPQGSSIHAPASGYTIKYRDAGYGYSYIVLFHGEGLSTVYGHVTASFVAEGQHVNRGDVIGLSGGMPGTRGAGWLTTGPHLHFEVHSNGVPVDPLNYLASL